MEAAWAGPAGVAPTNTCRGSWDSPCGTGRDFIVGSPLAAAAVVDCFVANERWIQPHLAVKSFFNAQRWTCEVTQPIVRTPLSPGSWLPAVGNSRGSKAVEVQRAWEM